jgi:hypothetical protein
MAKTLRDDLRRIVGGLFGFGGPSWVNWFFLILLVLGLVWLVLWGPGQMW